MTTSGACPALPAQSRAAPAGLAVFGLSSNERTAMGTLAAPEQFEVMSDGTLQADLEVPAGTWRLWADRGLAVWISRQAGGQMPRLPSMTSVDLFELLLRIDDAGLMLRDLRVLCHDRWGRRMRAPQALAYLADSGTVEAIDAVWSGRSGRAVRAQLHSSGLMYASDSASIAYLAEAIGGSIDG